MSSPATTRAAGRATTAYRLRPSTGPARLPAPVLDADQRAVVDHASGPLLLLAGPGTGKTTTVVESIVERVQRRGLRPEQVLVLTFSRKAAEDLRTRIGARLGGTTSGPLASTVHAFAYAVVRRFSDPGLYARPPDLLSAPEQDVRLRELLAGGLRTGRVDWPPSVRPALRTRGLAAELRALMVHARSLRLDPDDVERAGRACDRPEWVAAGQFFAEALEVLDDQALVDHAELVHRATILAVDHRDRLRGELRYVVVDEYQDTDPAQVALLQALAGGGRDLLVAGDPDQSIYGFRGADVRGLLRFPATFRTATGAPAPVQALRTSRRLGPALLCASRGVVDPLPIPGSLDRDTFDRFRRPGSAAGPDGVVEVRTFVSPAAEAEHVALLLRRAHLDDDLPWSQMAVLVRSAVQSVPRLQRALSAAGVPVEVAGDELPLRTQPAVQVLLRALRAADALSRRSGGRSGGPPGGRARDAADVRAGHPAAGPAPAAPLSADDAEALLTSPLGGMGPSAVRRLSRKLREADRADHAGVRPPRPSGQLLAEAVADPEALAAVGGDEAARTRRLAVLLDRARGQLDGGTAVEEVLWTVWEGTGWPGRLVRTAEAGGHGAGAAHRDLDAVVELFELAGRATGRQHRRGVGAFLDEVEAQQIPADTLAERGVRGEAVRLLTAHRSKGLQWRLVVVAGVQEGGWPQLRRRGSLLAADLLGPDGELPGPPTSASLLAEERRLFYVAVTRARERLLVTAVRGAREAGDQPSRFLADLGVPVGQPEPRPRRPASLPGLLGELRARAEAAADPGVRRCLARRIARLAHAGVLPAADPDRWWGVRDSSDAPVPVRPADSPVALSASAVQAIDACPLRWFLSREAGGQTQASTAQGFGGIVHALAAAVLDGQLAPDTEAMLAELDRVWDQLRFPVSWASDAEREAAGAALARLLTWHGAERGRTPLAAEVGFEATVPVGDDTVVLRGSIDRVEVDAEGRAVVVDLKTSKTAPSAAEVARHAQLGTYQVAVREGGLDGVAGRRLVPGGAELVQLRQQLRSGVKVQHQPAPTADEPSEADEQLARALVAVRTERFAATPGPVCGHCEFQPCCPAQPVGRALLAAPEGDNLGSDEP